jgi:hypothetical protein
MSQTALQAVTAQETAEALPVLLTIEHSAWAAPIRLTDDRVDIISRGNTYTAFPFELQLPNEQADTISTVQLVLDNVDRTITAELRAIQEAPTVTFEVVLASDPDTVEAGPFVFEWQKVTYDALEISGELVNEAIHDEPFPAARFTPGVAPELF